MKLYKITYKPIYFISSAISIIKAEDSEVIIARDIMNARYLHLQYLHLSVSECKQV